MKIIEMDNITGNAIELIPLSLNDVVDMHSYISNPDVSKFIGWSLTKSIDETEKFICELLNNIRNRTHIYASIVLKNKKQVIGNIMLFNFNFDKKSVELGYVLSQKSWGNGIISEAVKLVVEFSFSNLDIEIIIANVIESNIGSVKVLEKNKFLLKERIKKKYLIEDEYYDGLCYEIKNNI